jgi:hypothetical protein
MHSKRSTHLLRLDSIDSVWYTVIYQFFYDAKVLASRQISKLNINHPLSTIQNCLFVST